MKAPKDLRKSSRRSSRSTRGVTLIESVVAVAVLGVGTTILFGAIGRLQVAQRSMRIQAKSLEVHSRVAAEIAIARCDVSPNAPVTIVPAQTDPGLAITAPGTWVTLPVAGSAITTVGDLPGQPINVTYRVAADTSADPAAPDPAAGFHIDVRTREIMNDPAMDDPALESGYWIRILPVKKTCDIRSSRTLRGVI